MSALSSDGIRILRELDVAAARKAWPGSVGELINKGDEGVEALMHCARRRFISEFTLEERRTSTVWLIMHGFAFPPERIMAKPKKV